MSFGTAAFREKAQVVPFFSCKGFVTFVGAPSLERGRGFEGVKISKKIYCLRNIQNHRLDNVAQMAVALYRQTDRQRDGEM
jgi:hypothetical protein